MIKPPKAEVLTDGASRKKVYAYDYDALWRYCAYIEKQKVSLTELVKNNHEIIESYQKESIKDT